MIEDFSLRTCLIPELLENKIDFRILKYENGNPEKPTSLMVCYKYIDICRVDSKNVIGSTDCYDVMWHSKAPGRFNTGYARAIDLVHDIRKVIDFNFKGENNMNKKAKKSHNNYRGGFTTWRNEYQKERDKFEIKDVIFNNPATIVFWTDGTKTVVKAENEEFDPEKGLAMAIAKKALGNNYDYYDVFKKYVGRYEKKQKKGN